MAGVSPPPYLWFGETERPIMGPAVEIFGNACALRQLRAQIDQTPRDEGCCPLDDAFYRDEHGEEYEVAVTESAFAAALGTVQQSNLRRDNAESEGGPAPDSHLLKALE